MEKGIVIAASPALDPIVRAAIEDINNMAVLDFEDVKRQLQNEVYKFRCNYDFGVVSDNLRVYMNHKDKRYPDYGWYRKFEKKRF